jgi:2,3-dihydroxybenzoate decarboxylase
MYNLEVLGLDRVLYAADYPFQEVPSAVAVHDDLPIDNQDKRKIYELNAVNLFRLNER